PKKIRGNKASSAFEKMTRRVQLANKVDCGYRVSRSIKKVIGKELRGKNAISHCDPTTIASHRNRMFENEIEHNHATEKELIIDS
ncbi:13536_t:CDS:1, partial [Ambispora leptoticha]